MFDGNQAVLISHEMTYKKVLIQARGVMNKNFLCCLSSSQNSFTCKNNLSFLYGRKKIMICAHCDLQCLD